jgi:hypothetical protein
MQAHKAGAHEALMLDPQGWVATCNSTNFFIVRNGEVWTAAPKNIMNGITRRNVLRLCQHAGIPCKELDFSLTQVRWNPPPVDVASLLALELLVHKHGATSLTLGMWCPERVVPTPAKGCSAADCIHCQGFSLCRERLPLQACVCTTAAIASPECQACVCATAAIACPEC